MNRIYVTLANSAAVLLLVRLAGCETQVGQARVSEFGKYEGYSEAIYDGAQRTSDFLTLTDGTRLAYDLFLPTKKGSPADKPLPVLFKYTPYDRAWAVFDKDGKVVLCDLMTAWWCDPAMRLRAFIVPLVKPGSDGRVQDALARTAWVAEIMKYGYAVIVVDRRGTGASFGQYNGDPEAAAADANEVLEWIAAQPWSDGNIGMFGDSIQAQVQFQAASMGNPHLKAIFPATTWMDNSSAVAFPGGIPDTAFAKFYARANQAFDRMATPVDQDRDGSLLAETRAARGNASALGRAAAGLLEFAFRDTRDASGEPLWAHDHTLYPLLDRINRSGTAVYLINGWYDIYARDNFLIYQNLTVPKRLMVRPADHSNIEAPGSDVSIAAEAHRWFDYWLKGIDNGILDEPSIHYYLQGAPKNRAWQTADSWPPKEYDALDYYFAAAEAGAGLSRNDGGLEPLSPTSAASLDTYNIDYTPTTGTLPLWSAPAMPHKYPNMRAHDSRALTYTTSPLRAAARVVGHPIVHVWLSTGAPDLDLFAYLEQVDGNGNSTYITEGQLRASHRLVSRPPFDNLGLPWRNHFESELQPIPAGEPLELVFDLRPTSWQFPKGSRIRITIAFADAGNFDTPVLDPPPTVRLLRDSAHPSYIELPIVPSP